jgi:hypothetical protein
MILSKHALEEMRKQSITEEEVKKCLDDGELEIRQIVNSETRCGKKIDFKEKTVVVIYTQKAEERRVITAYVVRRKKQWHKN